MVLSASGKCKLLKIIVLRMIYSHEKVFPGFSWLEAFLQKYSLNKREAFGGRKNFLRLSNVFQAWGSAVCPFCNEPDPSAAR